jgi:hypothetical protein
MIVLSACIDVRRHDVYDMYDVHCIAHMTRVYIVPHTPHCVPLFCSYHVGDGGVSTGMLAA